MPIAGDPRNARRRDILSVTTVELCDADLSVGTDETKKARGAGGGERSRCVITPRDARPVRVPNVHSSQCDAHTFISRNPAQPASQANRKSFLFLWYTFSVTKAVEWQRGFSLAGGYRFVTTHKYLSARRRAHLNDLTYLQEQELRCPCGCANSLPCAHTRTWFTMRK